MGVICSKIVINHFSPLKLSRSEQKSEINVRLLFMEKRPWKKRYYDKEANFYLINFASLA